MRGAAPRGRARAHERLDLEAKRLCDAARRTSVDRTRDGLRLLRRLRGVGEVRSRQVAFSEQQQRIEASRDGATLRARDTEGRVAQRVGSLTLQATELAA